MTNTLAKNVRAIEAVRPRPQRTAYTIKGEPGLRLIVHPTGRKVWYAVYQLGKGKTRKRRWSEIGTHPEISLSDAVESASKLRAAVAKGDDPQAPTTFSGLFTAWLEEHAKKKLETWADEERRYGLHLKRPLADKLLSEIARKDVREIRDNVLERSGPIQSNRVVALFNRVMNWAVDEDRAKFNPAARLKKVGEENRRERVLSPDELARMWAALDQPLAVDHEQGGLTEADLKAAIAVRRAIKLLVVTGQRRGEVIGLRKAEIDNEGWWTIPGSRTKNGLPHRVPLTKTALVVLAQALEASGDSEFVFPSTKTEGAIRPDAVTKQLQRMLRRMEPRIEGAGPHDIRRTVGTIMRKLGVSVEDRGYVFNHISGAKSKVTSWNYDAGEHDKEKSQALEKWERELMRIIGARGNNIVPLRA